MAMINLGTFKMEITETLELTMEKTLFAALAFIFFISSAVFAREMQDANKSSPYIVEVNAHDYRFEMPSTLKSGWITFELHNKGSEMHVALLGKRPDSVPLEEFKAAINDLRAVPMQSYGGPGLHSPGQNSQTAIKLPPGDYVLICGTRNAAGHSHFRLGMMHYFNVVDEPNGAPEPAADANMTISMYDVNTDSGLKPGSNTIRIENLSGYFGDVHLVSLNGDASMTDAREYLENIKEPAPAHFLGGIEQGPPEVVHYLTVDLDEGDYGWISHEAGGFGVNETFEVTNDGNSGGIEFDDIDHQMTIQFSEDGINVPGSVQRGRVKIVNDTRDNRQHSLLIFRLLKGKTASDARDFALGQNKNIQEGKLDMDKGLSPAYQDFRLILPVENPENDISVELTPGKYALMCLGGLGTPSPHHEHGGLATFSVEEKSSDTLR